MTGARQHARPATLLAGNLEPVSRNTLQEQVYSQIRQGLIDGEFQPGQVLTIRNLAAQLGTSVMPVREALQKLVAERILELLPTRSLRVPILSGTDFAEICDVRMVLEGHATQLAATRAELRDMQRIDAAYRACASIKATESPAVIQRKNREFHFAIYRAAHNDTLMELIEPLWVRCGPCTLTFFSELSPNDIQHVAAVRHQRAVEAIQAHQETQARDAIVEDILATSIQYQNHYH